MTTTISGLTGVSQIQDGVVTQADLGAGIVSQSKLAANVVGTGPVFTSTLTVSQNVSSGANTKLNMVASFDSHGYFSAGRFTPLIAGYYQFNVSVYGSASANTLQNIFAGISKNASVVSWSTDFVTNQTTGFQSCSTMIYLNGTTDYVEAYGIVSGTNPTFLGSLQNNFSGFLVRAA